MTITIIAAMDKNGAIGKGGKFPWYLPRDLRHLKEVTLGGHGVVMGYKTMEVLGAKPLPNITNIVLADSGRPIRPTRHGEKISELGFYCPDIVSAQGWFETFKKTKDKTIFVIGGQSIFEQAIPYASRIILTQIDTIIEGADSFFPAWAKNKWRLESSKDVNNEGELPYKIEEWVRC